MTRRLRKLPDDDRRPPGRPSLADELAASFVSMEEHPHYWYLLRLYSSRAGAERAIVKLRQGRRGFEFEVRYVEGEWRVYGRATRRKGKR